MEFTQNHVRKLGSSAIIPFDEEKDLLIKRKVWKSIMLSNKFNKLKVFIA